VSVHDGMVRMVHSTSDGWCPVQERRRPIVCTVQLGSGGRFGRGIAVLMQNAILSGQISNVCCDHTPWLTVNLRRVNPRRSSSADVWFACKAPQTSAVCDPLLYVRTLFEDVNDADDNVICHAEQAKQIEKQHQRTPISWAPAATCYLNCKTASETGRSVRNTCARQAYPRCARLAPATAQKFSQPRPPAKRRAFQGQTYNSGVASRGQWSADCQLRTMTTTKAP
jgi:hypothetical protein